MSIEIFHKDHRFFNAKVVWWPDVRKELKNPDKVDLVYFLLVDNKTYIPQDIDFRVTYTNVIDLTKDIDLIYKRFDYKSCKYMINKAKKYKDLDFNIFQNPEEKKLNEFLQMVKTFYESKKLPHDEIDNNYYARLKPYLTMTTLERYAKIAIGHLYIHDNNKNKARLLFSAQHKQEGDTYDFGAINRWLHFEDIKYFKKQGYKIFDWGGIVKEENHSAYGVTLFKKSFGGEDMEEYSFRVIFNPVFKFLAFASKMLRSHNSITFI